MKSIFLFVTLFLFVAGNCLSQVKAVKPLTQKTVVSTPTNKITKTVTSATLSNEYFSITNKTGKAANIHWSCSLYDQNNKQVASFQDNNQDEYSAGSEVSNLKMQNINAATFGDFSKGGRLHIAVESKGNESWTINVLKLMLDFLNPNFTQNLTWKAIDLSGGKKELDLFFKDAAQSPTGKYDIMANKKA